LRISGVEDLIGAIFQAEKIELEFEEKGYFEPKAYFYFTTKSAESFTVGMPIKLSGFNIGKIDNITLNDDGTVTMAFYVTKKNLKWFTQNSTLLLKKPLIGSPHIEVHSQTHQKPLQAGAKLTIIMSDDINDMIVKLEPVLDKVIHIIGNIDTLTTDISKPNSDLLLTMKNIQLFSKKLAQNDALLTTLTGDKNATQNSIEAIANINATLKNINHISQKLSAQVLKPTSQTILELLHILQDVHNKLQMLNGVVKSVAGYDKDLGAIKKQVELSVQKSNQIMDKVDVLLPPSQTPKEVKLP